TNGSGRAPIASRSGAPPPLSMRSHEEVAVIEYLGWTATAVFVGSYFCRPTALKRVQMIGALMWVVYGFLIRASPVVAANLLVFAAASATRGREQSKRSA